MAEVKSAPPGRLTRTPSRVELMDMVGKEAEDMHCDGSLAVIVLGASGDLARKKTYPALWKLHLGGLLPASTIIVGYARSAKEDEEFREYMRPHLKGGDPEQVEDFLQRCFYSRGGYDSAEDMAAAVARLDRLERAVALGAAQNRIFYLAVPPSVFAGAAAAIKASGMSESGWTRVVVEKPFGHDLESSEELARSLASSLEEKDLYRIDHYLGKEMVQSLQVLRFGNSLFEPIWSHHYISTVQIVFSEDIGTDGRGGYFDKIGIMRDVMQNHLLQILSLVAMEPPVSLSAEDVRDEKVKVLRAIPPLTLDDVVLGQYGPDETGDLPGYRDDPTVPDGSTCPTFATAVFRIRNNRWGGVPFILKAGKALRKRQTYVRIQFKKPRGALFPDVASNELVIRVQPDEAMWIKTIVKLPGLREETTESELDLTLGERFSGLKLPDAYERLLLDVYHGDHSHFVRDDELRAAWKIFTPLLHQIEREKVEPIIYTRGTRGPAESDELIQRAGYIRSTKYQWGSSGFS
eukprot:PLAT3339.2.p1 GENE.PLAT3339.2~~PLAT3339.2.p1  ORF type:complete len:528 (+),score=280.84 PLAT3339.2:25-1584(+)